MAYSRIKEELESNKQEFTYAEVLTMTKNLERVVGKGGFATVYYGRIDDTEVAVKMLSPSAQGYMQFKAEVLWLTSNMIIIIYIHTLINGILFMVIEGLLLFYLQAKFVAVVHHKYLTSLIGYCDDGEKMALIYEYMANGDFSKHLSGIF